MSNNSRSNPDIALLLKMAAVAGAYVPTALAIGTVSWLTYLTSFGATYLIAEVPSIKLLIGMGEALIPTVILLLVLILGYRLRTSARALKLVVATIAACTVLLISTSLVFRVIDRDVTRQLALAAYIFTLILVFFILELTVQDKPVHARLFV